MCKYRLKFKKIGKIKYIGHLDLLKVFQRAVKRARLPARYSEGFNPHQKSSFALPLGLGVESICEYADIELIEDISGEEVIKRLNAVLPEGFVFLEAEQIGMEVKTASLVQSASYEVLIDTQPEKAIEKINSLEKLVISKKSKSGTAETDIKPDIYSLSCMSGKIYMTLAAGSVRSLKSETVIGCICGITGSDPEHVKYTRTAIGIGAL